MLDLETLKKYSRGELDPKQFLAVHRDAGELLELLHKHLHTGEYVTTVADWPMLPSRKAERQYAVLKNMMLAAPFILVGGAAFMFATPFAMLITGMLLSFLFGGVAIGLILKRRHDQKSRRGRSALAVTSRRILRVWLDGSGDVQSWPLTSAETQRDPIEPVSETIQLLLQLDLGKTSLN